MSYGSGRSDSRIYVGNLPPDIRTKDIEDFFRKYGKISFVDLKNRKGPPFAFIEFEDSRDADDAVRARDGYDYDGYRLRVEFPRGGGPRGPGGRRLWESGGGGGGGGGGGRGGRGGGPSRRTNYRVLVSGLPPTGSWQDLKDHMREAGDVCYADVFRDGTGVVEYLRYDDMKYALRKLDDTKFRSHEGETSYIRVKEEAERGGARGGDYRNGRARSRSRSPSPRPRARASPTYSPARKSRSRSRSASKSRSRSASKSRSRSARSRSRSASRSRSRS